MSHMVRLMPDGRVYVTAEGVALLWDMASRLADDDPELSAEISTILDRAERRRCFYIVNGGGDADAV